jgi:DNA-binding SARP family transcriptional activator
MSRSRAAGTLWPDTTEQHALGNLRSVLWRLHRSPQEVLGSAGGYLGLSADVSVDLREMESLAFRISDLGHRIEDSEVNRACDWGDILPDWSEDWLLIERERFRQLRLHTMEVLSERLAADGRFGQAVMAGLAAVGAEPLRESAQRILIKAHLSEGNRSEAARQYALYRNLLTSDLGLEPSGELRALLWA